jgi:putative transposase
MPTRRTSDLHRGRSSTAGARYFITCCTEHRNVGLDTPIVGASLLANVRTSDAVLDTTTFGFVIMPDHLHWLFGLGGRLSLGQVIGKFKRATSADLAAHGLAWQRDFFEHRLRIDETVESYARYIYLNPYRRARELQISTGRVQSAWWTPQPEQLRFLTLLNPDGTPPPEWFDDPPPL